MRFIKKLIVGGVFAYVMFNFIFGGTIFANNYSSNNGILTKILTQTTMSQNGRKISLSQGLAEMTNELGLNMKPEEWITNPNKATNQAFEQLNAALMELYKEAGIDIQSTGDFNTDTNAAIGASMQQITDELNRSLTSINQK